MKNSNKLDVLKWLNISTIYQQIGSSVRRKVGENNVDPLKRVSQFLTTPREELEANPDLKSHRTSQELMAI